MFSFFHRKKKVVVDCFTTLTPVFEYTPIVRASKTFPDWWKNLPTVGPLKVVNGIYEKHNNMKGCYGFTELYKRGLVIESWSDMHIKVTQNSYDFHTSIGALPLCHSTDEYEGGFKDFHHMKMISPWHFKEKTGMKFLFMGAEWNNELPYKTLPGVVEFKNVSGTNVNIMMPKMNFDYEIDIKIGQPLVHLVPLMDDVDVKIKCHLVSEGEMATKQLWGAVSYGGMRNLIKLRNRNEKRKSKCPF
jgi:hypothetical protein